MSGFSVDIKNTFGDCKLLEYIILTKKHKRTGNTKHIVAGKRISNFSLLAICQEKPGFYLYYCDSNWEVITDSFHFTIEDAKNQASFEYEGIKDTDWIKII